MRQITLLLYLKKKSYWVKNFLLTLYFPATEQEVVNPAISQTRRLLMAWQKILLSEVMNCWEEIHQL